MKAQVGVARTVISLILITVFGIGIMTAFSAYTESKTYVDAVSATKIALVLDSFSDMNAQSQVGYITTTINQEGSEESIEMQVQQNNFKFQREKQSLPIIRYINPSKSINQEQLTTDEQEVIIRYENNNMHIEESAENTKNFYYECTKINAQPQNTQQESTQLPKTLIVYDIEDTSIEYLRYYAKEKEKKNIIFLRKENYDKQTASTIIFFENKDSEQSSKTFIATTKASSNIGCQVANSLSEDKNFIRIFSIEQHLVQSELHKKLQEKDNAMVISIGELSPKQAENMVDVL